MITSTENKRVKDWCRLHLKKYRTEEYLLYDPELIEAALSTGHLRTLIHTGEAPFPFEDCVEVSKEVLDKITEGKDVTCAGVAVPVEEKKTYGKRVFLLDHLQDPLNVGRILETAERFGFDTVLLSDNAPDLYHEKALEASKGAIYRVSVCHGDLLEEIAKLRSMGFYVASTGLRGETAELYYVAPREKMAIVLGNEGSGVSEAVMDASDEIIKIDMEHIDSLNVGMAAAIVAYRFRNIYQDE